MPASRSGFKRCEGSLHFNGTDAAAFFALHRRKAFCFYACDLVAFFNSPRLPESRSTGVKSERCKQQGAFAVFVRAGLVAKIDNSDPATAETGALYRPV